MKAKDIVVGGIYAAKVSEIIVPVEIRGDHPRRGWVAKNLSTDKFIHIASAQRLRYRMEKMSEQFINLMCNAERHRKNLSAIRKGS